MQVQKIKIGESLPFIRMQNKGTVKVQQILQSRTIQEFPRTYVEFILIELEKLTKT